MRLVASKSRVGLIVLALLVLWIVFGLVIHVFARDLNAVELLGFPLGYWFASQGAVTLFVALVVWFSTMERGRRDP